MVSLLKPQALRLVHDCSLEPRPISFDHEGPGHSLHYVLPYPESFTPNLPAYFIERFSNKREVVLDPFCGSGTTLLEAALRGRVAFGADVDPLALKISAAKIQPADLTEVTMFLQGISLRKPISVSQYQEQFRPFFDLDTFRELLCLRDSLRESIRNGRQREGRFVELVALSLLHGASAGHFSTHTFPQISLSPAEQEKLNIRRRQSPDYRAVVPRILRKTAFLLRDGLPTSLQKATKDHLVLGRDARNMGLSSGSVDLVVCGPPLPTSRDWSSDQWLRSWFGGLPSNTAGVRFVGCNQLASWLEFMNEVLFDLARILKRGKRAVFDLREIPLEGRRCCLDTELVAMVQEHLGNLWEPEHVLVQEERATAPRRWSSDPYEAFQRGPHRVLVLKRR